MLNYHKQYLALAHSNVTRKNHLVKVNSFMNKATKLFDVSSCKCSCFNSCKCSKEKKVPQIERAFLTDQRTHRKMVIGSIDEIISQQTARRIERKQKTSEYESQRKQTEKSSINQSGSPGRNERQRDESNVQIQKVSSYNNVSLKTVAQTADRYMVSHTIAAAISSAALVDYHIITEDNTENVIDKKKIARAREKSRREQVVSHNEREVKLIAFYFDSRLDKTINLDGSLKDEKEDHYSLIEEPGSHFLSYLTINANQENDDRKKGQIVQNEFTKYFTTNKISLQSLDGIGSDGTGLNTGNKGGIICLLENYLKRSLQWIICIIHCNELPLRHLITSADGDTKSPTTLSGPIGKKLSICEDLPVVKFKPIPFPCDVKNIKEVSRKFSTDQLYLYDMCVAISNGVCDESLAKRSPGKLNHARWLTTANRTLRYYASTTKPSKPLLAIVQYIMISYAPTFFNVKYQSSVCYGSVHLANLIKSCQNLPKNYKKVVNETIQRNGFFGHPENVLVAMVNDDRGEIRLHAWSKILEARQKVSIGDTVRKFVIPELNFDCQDYTELIDINSVDISSPPILNSIVVTAENVAELASKKIFEMDLCFDIKDLPSHTQAVERSVKLVTEASISVPNEKLRMGWILNTLESRNIMPNFNSKKNYQIKNAKNCSKYNI